MRKRTVRNIARILAVLKETPLHLRGISRVTGLNPFVVSHIIDRYLSPFVEIKQVDEFGLKVKIISLKKDVSVSEVLRYARFRKAMKEF